MSNEPLIRTGAFFVVLLFMLAAEMRWPRRPSRSPKVGPFLNNIGISVLSTGLVRLLFPLLPVTLAIAVEQKGWGVFNLTSLPPVMSLVAGIVILDIAIYAQHVAFHRFSILWRIHRMHHADTDIDTSTGVRFHPLEIGLSMVFKLALIILFGISATAVLIFEITLNACSLFNHANLALPETTDRWLRLLLVTPDMHRVHHSTDGIESNHNYGFCVPWWDRLFRTYKSNPDAGHLGMNIGLNILREARYRQLFGMLTIPFLRRK